MKREERFREAYEYLRSKGIVHTQKALAQKMGASAPNVSSALKGVEEVLTDKFLHRFNSSFNNIFNEEWLLCGNGEMLSGNEYSNDNNTRTNKLIDTIALLQDTVNKLQQKNNELEDEIRRLRAELTVEKNII